MKLIFVAPMLMPIPSEKGAIEEIIWQLAKRFRQKFQVQLFNPIAAKRTCINSVLRSFKLLYNVKSHDIIHSHNLYASISLSHFNKAIHILTLHYPPWITRSRFHTHILLSLLRLLNKRNVIITVPSLYIKQKLNRLNISSIYIPNGVDINMFNPNNRDEELREKLLDGNDVLIVNIARMHPDKNQLALLKAIKSVTRELKRVRIVFVGSTSGYFHKAGTNPYYLLLRKYTEKYGLEKNVIFLGEVKRRKDVAKILACGDIYVHPSKVEAFPLVLLEAMASGLPIIAFNLPFYKGYLFNGLNALLVPPFNIDELSKRLISLIIDNNLAKSLSSSSIQIVKRMFAWDKLTQIYEHLYLNALYETQ